MGDEEEFARRFVRVREESCMYFQSERWRRGRIKMHETEGEISFKQAPKVGRKEGNRLHRRRRNS